MMFGMNCTSATLMVPSKGRLISRYGVRRGRTTGEPTMHAGLDIGGLERHAAIFAPRAGIVEHVGRNEDRGGGFRGYGNCVVLRHDDEQKWTFYAHLHEAAVEVGQQIGAGEKLGAMGATTNGRFPGMGAHLHFEVRHAAPDGSSPYPGPYAAYNIDPRPWLEEHGLTFSRDGLEYEPFVGACASPVGPPRHLEQLNPHYATYADPEGPSRRRLLNGLGAPDAGVDAGVPDYNRDYEPPIPDKDLFGGTPLWLHGVAAVAVAGIGVAGLVIAKR